MKNRLAEKLRDLKYEQRLEQVALLASHGNSEEQAQLATALIRELAMHRVFDRFTKPQQEKLLDRLSPLANPVDLNSPPAFGQGAISQLTFDYE